MWFVGKDDKEDEYYFDFKGARLTIFEAKKLGFGILFGLLGGLLMALLPFELNGPVSFIVLGVFFSLGYFMVGPKILLGKKKEDQKGKEK